MVFLSTLDLASGFWTLPIREEDKHLTAFVTHRQKYEFNYLPFGINSGPSYMVRRRTRRPAARDVTY